MLATPAGGATAWSGPRVSYRSNHMQQRARPTPAARVYSSKRRHRPAHSSEPHLLGEEPLKTHVEPRDGRAGLDISELNITWAASSRKKATQGCVYHIATRLVLESVAVRCYGDLRTQRGATSGVARFNLLHRAAPGIPSIPSAHPPASGRACA